MSQPKQKAAAAASRTTGARGKKKGVTAVRTTPYLALTHENIQALKLHRTRLWTKQEVKLGSMKLSRWQLVAGQSAGLAADEGLLAHLEEQKRASARRTASARPLTRRTRTELGLDPEEFNEAPTRRSGRLSAAAADKAEGGSDDEDNMSVKGDGESVRDGDSVKEETNEMTDDNTNGNAAASSSSTIINNNTATLPPSLPSLSSLPPPSSVAMAAAAPAPPSDVITIPDGPPASNIINLVDDGVDGVDGAPS